MLEPAGVSGSVATVAPRWRPRLDPARGLAIAALIASLVVGLWPGSAMPSIALFVPIVLVITAHVRAWRGEPAHALRPAWSLMVFGMVLTFAGEVARIGGEEVLGWPVAVVTVGLNLAAYPFFLVSSGVRIQRAAGRSMSVAAMLDALTCALVTGVFGALIILPVIGTVPPAQLLGAIMPPVLCLGLLVVALYLVFQTARERPHTAALALVLAAILSTTGNWLVALDTLATSAPWALPSAMVFLVGCFLVLARLPTLDLRESHRWPDPIGHLQSALVQALPLVLLALLAVQVIAYRFDGGNSSVASLLMERALAIGTLLVVARQWLMLRLNVRLLTSLQTSNAALAQAHAQSAREARTDHLTGLPNQRLMREYLTTAVATHRRAGLPLSLLFVDIDHFKLVNDRHGHAAGDAVLAEIGGRMRQSLREGDIVARYGGEEFVLILPHTDEFEGQAVAERLRQAIANEPVTVPAGRSLTVTVSIGLATGYSAAMSANSLLHAADAAMYAAKHAGRDGVRVTAD